VHLLEGIDENGEIRPEAEEAVMEELKGNFRPEFFSTSSKRTTEYGFRRTASVS